MALVMRRADVQEGSLISAVAEASTLLAEVTGLDVR